MVTEWNWVPGFDYNILIADSNNIENIFLVNIKWGKEKFEGVEVNTDEPPMLLKAQLFALSGVQPERQKVMVKGQVIKVC